MPTTKYGIRFPWQDTRQKVSQLMLRRGLAIETLVRSGESDRALAVRAGCEPSYPAGSNEQALYELGRLALRFFKAMGELELATRNLTNALYAFEEKHGDKESDARR